MNSLTIVAVSDTHGMHGNVQVPAGDVFVHCGDLCSHGRREEIGYFADWLGSLPHTHKLITPGNHDRPIEADPLACRQIFEAAGARLLINELLKGVVPGNSLIARGLCGHSHTWRFPRKSCEQCLLAATLRNARAGNAAQARHSRHGECAGSHYVVMDICVVSVGYKRSIQSSQFPQGH